MVTIKTGDKVKLVDTKGLSCYKVYARLLKIKNKTMVVRKVKDSGGILLQGFCVGYNMFDVEQGLMPDRFEKIKTKNKKK